MGGQGDKVMGGQGDKGTRGQGDGEKLTVNCQLTPMFLTHSQIFLSANCYNESKLSNCTPVKNSDRTFNYFNWLKKSTICKE